MSQDQPEVVVHLVLVPSERTHQIAAYASKDEAETIAKLHDETVETVPVIGAVAFTADELVEIADILERCTDDVTASGDLKGARHLHAMEVKARNMALLEVVNQP